MLRVVMLKRFLVSLLAVAATAPFAIGARAANPAGPAATLVGEAGVDARAAGPAQPAGASGEHGRCVREGEGPR